MSVTDKQPTKVGQRVQEIFTNSRGWIIELGWHGGEDVAIVDWDEKPVGDGDELFPLDALRVVQVIRMDLDWYNDPGCSPFIEMVSMADSAPDLNHARYHWKDGGVSVGIDNARVSLMTRCTADKDA